MKRRVFVQVWTEIDPTLNLCIDRQTGLPAASEGDVILRVSPQARFGLATALDLADAVVTAFALGAMHDEALRHALAAGAARAVRLKWPGDSAAPLGGLADWIAAEKPDLVIADRTAGMVAARLGWSHLAGLDHLEITENSLKALRTFGRGAYEKVAAKLPAVVRVQTESPRMRYLARTRLQAVTHLPIEEAMLAAAIMPKMEIDEGALQLARPRTRLAPTAPVPAKAADRLSALMGLTGRTSAATQKLATSALAKRPVETQNTADELAQEFVRYLAHNDLLPESSSK